MSPAEAFRTQVRMPTYTTGAVSGRHGMRVCTGCAKTVLITIRMRVAGREIVFHRCSKCEANTWQDDVGVLSLDEVLELARAGR
jgi:hypothetical protein